MQRDHFPAEVESLSKGSPVPCTSRIPSLDPQLVDRVLRVNSSRRCCSEDGVDDASRIEKFCNPPNLSHW